ncbi:GDSL-type esterase/lipase family protein [Paenibacillus aquistagni]|uniref:GDSL-type esterase/lipase family protein n=1 Tax=Paenibacillus aquistagni TaxID=1852522 RepID=UPI000B507E36|nr:GDSL-type esterase/lipase family protein [Paenibacillus aquistagni]NMM54207.1 GDSL family lipase [Paenibacillus aquistagni]
MKRKGSLWSIIALIGCLSSALLLTGFILGVTNVLHPGSVPFTEKPVASTPEVPVDNSKAEYRIVAIGDSLTRGTGDDTGKGYVRRTVEMLEKHKREAKLLNNLAINGLRADQLVTRLDEEHIGYSLKQANLVLLTIGGNDLFQGAQSEQLSSAQLNIEYLNKKADESISSLKQVLNKIRETNKDALIVFVGLYNPFSNVKEMSTVGSSVVERWNHAAKEFMNEDANMLMIPTQDLFEHNIDKYIAADHFHPNGTGYDAIATRIVQSLP